MKNIMVLSILIVSVLTLKAQNTSNIFIGTWQIDEFKTVIGNQEIYAYQRDSLEKCKRLLLISLGTIIPNPTQSDSSSTIEEVNSNFDAFDSMAYQFLSDTLLSINGVKKTYKIDTRKQWIMLDPNNFEAGWSAYKVNNDHSVELWQEILAGWIITTLRRK